jgi:hypothetical protein
LVLVIPGDLSLEQGVGVFVIRDFFVGQQGDEAFLEGVEAVGGRTMAKEGEAVGVEAGGRAVAFEGRAQVGEVIPSGVAADEGAGDGFAGVIVEGENEHGVMVGRPPRMGRGVVLPEFADGAGLPAAAEFGASSGRGNLPGEVLADVGRDGGAGAVEVMTAGQFVGQEGEVERLAVRQELFEEIVDGGRPRLAVIAAGGGQVESRRGSGAIDGAVDRAWRG